MSLDTTPRTWTTSELVTAAMLNTEVRDALTGIQAAWTAYTPTWTSSGTAPALGNGTLTGAYLQIGNTVLWRMTFQAGSTTTFGSGAFFYWALPPSLTPIQNPAAIGTGLFQDSSAGNAGYTYEATYLGDAGGMRFYSTSGAPSVAVSPLAPVTWAVSDRIVGSGSYEVA